MTTAAPPSERVRRLAAMFGLGLDEERTIAVVPRVSLTLAPGRVVFITGASGGGKSTLLRCIRENLEQHHDVRLVEFGCGIEKQCRRRYGSEHSSIRKAAFDLPLVESLGATLGQAVRYLSLAGLGDAPAMLRQPSQLSDGQRHRWLLARCMEKVSGAVSAAATAPDTLSVLIADEFCSTLDRLTAAIVARNVRKWAVGQGVCFIAASAHDDLLEHLDPDTLIVQQPGVGIEVMERKLQNDDCKLQVSN